MNQLYKIGILVAVLLLVLLGFSKLTNNTNDRDELPEFTLPEETESYSDDSVAPTDESLSDIESLLENEAIMSDTQGNTTVVMKTNKGDITIELFTEAMPITAGNFLKLAKENFYDGVKFHRVMDGFMIQGGDPYTKDDTKKAQWGTGGPGYAIEDEHVPGFSNVRGTISMANSGPNSGGSQFFINLVDNVNLDFDKQPLSSKHPVFGRVIEGMGTVDAIAQVPTGGTVPDTQGTIPTEAIVINDIVVQ